MKKFLRTFVMLALLAVPWITQAQQTVTIGDGTSAGYYTPIGTYYNYSITEQLYTADEIGTAGTIQSISFSYAASSAKDFPITVYMANVDAEDLTTGISLADAEQVFSGTLSVTGAGWVTITLDNPFYYDGASNLLIGFIKDYVYWYSGSTWNYTAASNMARYSQNDNDGYTTSTVPGTTTNNRPNIQIVITPSGNADCPRPASFSIVEGTLTAHEVTVTWEPTDAGDYIVEYKMASQSNDEWEIFADGLSDDEAQEFMIDGLDQNTTYNLRVYSVCGEDDEGLITSAPRNLTFTTAISCPAPTDLNLAGNAEAHGATFTWTNNADLAQQFVFEYKKATDEEWTLADDAIAENTYTLEGLTQNTAYIARVSADCDDEGVSGYATKTFTTAIACPAPTDLAATLTQGDGTVATLTWTAGGEETVWHIMLGDDEEDYAEVTIDDFEEGETLHYNLEDLTPEQTYTAKVRAYCDDEDQSSWVSVTFTPTNAYSITVNDGTTTNSYVPIYGLWVDNITKSQFIIPATDLTDIAWGTITKLTFYSSTASAGWAGAQFEVYMAETNATTLSELGDYTTMTKVMNAAHLEISDNIMEVTLDEPYQYMGGNLMIGFLQTVSGSFNSSYWYGVEATGASFGGYGTGTNLSQQDFLPKTTIDYIPGEEPECLMPTGITVAYNGGTTATVTWTSEAESFNVMVNGEVVEEGIEGNTYTLEGLELATTYAVSVQADCGGATSDWTTPKSFTTDLCMPENMCAVNIALVDSYGDGWNGNNMYVVDALTNTVIGTYTISSGSSATFAPQICDGREINFVYDANGSYTYENGWNITDINGEVITEQEATGNYEYPLSASTVNYTMNCTPTTCLKPTALAAPAATVGPHQVTLSWTEMGEATEWTVAYKPTAVPATNDDEEEEEEVEFTEVIAETNPFVLDGLDYETEYIVKVRANCGENDESEEQFSNWSNAITFTTAEACPGIAASSIQAVAGPDYVNMTWASNNVEGATYNVYKYIPGETEPELVGENVDLPTAEEPFVVDGLDPETQYTFGVKPICEEGDAPIATVSCTTSVACPLPEALVAEDVTATEATLSWTGLNPNASYNVTYRPASAYVPVFEDDFENGINNWTVYTLAETTSGNEGWYVYDMQGLSDYAPHSGDYVVSSWSWNTDALNANNWLVSPQVTLGSVLKYWELTNSGWPDSYEILFSTTGNTVEDFQGEDVVTLRANATAAATGDWNEVIISTAEYAGQEGYIAIHHEDYDANYLLFDDFGVYNEQSAGEWVTITTNETSVTVDDLTSATTYEFKVQAVCGDNTTEWTDVANFSTIASCLPATDLAVEATTVNSITLTWTDNNDGSAYVVTDGEDNEVAFTMLETGMGCVVTGLEPNTAYTFKVKASCGDGDYSTAVSIHTRTACNAISELPWNEDFEGDSETETSTVPCWTLYTSIEDGTYPKILGNASYANSGVNSLYFYYGVSTSETLIAAMPPVNPDMISLSGKQVSLRVRGWTNDYGTFMGGSIEVGTMSNPNDPETFVLAGVATAATEEYTRFDILLGEVPEENIYVALRMKDAESSSEQIMIDDVALMEAPTCNYVRQNTIEVSEVAAHSATVTWSDELNEDASYMIYVIEEGEAVAFLDAPITLSDLPQMLTGLTPETDYVFAVAAVCSEDNTSEMTQFGFTTTIACPAPTTVAAELTPGNGTIATITWTENGEANQWEVQLGDDDPITVNGEDFEEGETPHLNLTGLTAEQEYTVKVRANCGEEDGMSAWSTPVTFIPTNAYEVTVHDGTATNGYLPVYGFYADAYLKGEMVYPAAELSNMSFGSITSMTFYASTPAEEEWTSTWQVFLSEVDDASISSFYGPSTVVYEGTLNGTASEMTINFTTPYQYNGGNLLVGVYNIAKGNYKSVTWIGETVEGASVQGYDYNSLDGVSPTQRNFLPKTTFGYIPGEAPACDAPTNAAISDVAAFEATFSWEGTASEYVLEYKAAGTDEWASVTVSNVPYTLEGLEQTTTYLARVKAVCDDEAGYSLYLNLGSFTTPVACPVPTNVVVVNGPTKAFVTWTASTNEDATYIIYDMSEANPEVYAENVALPTAENPYVIEGLDPETQYSFGVAANCGDVFGQSEIVPIDVQTTIACPAPANLSVITTTTTATLTWVDGNSENATYVIYDLSGEEPVAITEEPITFASVPYEITGLQANTEYTFGVQALCGELEPEDMVTITALTMEVCPDNYVCIGAGYNTTTYLPLYNLYEYSMTEQIYTAAEINHEAGAMTSVQFYAASGVTRTIDVYMVNTNKAAFANATDWIAVTEANRVFSGSVTFAAQDWTTINFDTPFGYDGTSNVALVVNDKTGTWNSSVQFVQFDANNQAIYAYQDGTSYNPSAPSSYTGTLKNTKNRVRFGMSNAYNVTVSVNPEEAGTVNVTETLVAEGGSLTLTATAAEGYVFAGWTVGEETITENPHTFVVNADMAIVANFNEIQTYALTVSANPANAGSVAAYAVIGEEQVSIEAPTTVAEGTSVILIAEAAEGYQFVNWTVNGTDVEADFENGYEFVMTADINVVANFELIPAPTYTVNVTVVPEAAATVAGIPEEAVEEGTPVTLTLTIADGYEFDGWFDAVGAPVSTMNPYTFQMPAEDVTLVANFSAIQYYTFTVATTDGGTVAPAGEQTIEQGAEVTLTATPNEGYHFVAWVMGENEVSTANPYTFTPEAGDFTITATFAENEAGVTYYAVTAVSSNTDWGTVSANVALGQVVENTSVTLTATAAEHYQFLGWVVDGSTVSTDASYTFTVTEAVDLIALFAPIMYEVTLNWNSEMGMVTGMPEAVNNMLQEGTAVTLVAQANENYHFVNWTVNNETVEDAILTFTVAENKTIVANFAINTYTVTLGQNVTANVEDLTAVAHGTEVTFTATAPEGYEFAGWTVNGFAAEANVDGTLTVTVTNDITVAATFTEIINYYAVTVNVTPANAGTVIANVANLAEVEENTMVTFTATAAEGYEFSSWMVGSATMPANQDGTLTVMVTGNITVTAVFTAVVPTYTVNVTWNQQQGNVTGVPTAAVEAGTSVTLTATAAEGYEFASWNDVTGAPVSTANPYTFTVNANVNLTATFTQVINYYTVTIAASQNGTVTANVENLNQVEEGTAVTFTATPAEGYELEGWTVNGQAVQANADGTLTVTVTENVTVAATFTAVAPATIDVTFTVNDPNMGSINPSGTQTFTVGTQVTVTATANEGYEFYGWELTVNGLTTTLTENVETTYTVDALAEMDGLTVKALFKVKVGIDDVDMNNVTIYSAEDVIYVRGAEGRNVTVFDLNGRVLNQTAKAGEVCEFRMNNTGIYLVKVGNAAAKRVAVVR